MSGAFCLLEKRLLVPISQDCLIYRLANDSLTRYYIDVAGGYGKVSTVFDSNSGGISVVVVGWDTDPTVELNKDDAYHISFQNKEWFS